MYLIKTESLYQQPTHFLQLNRNQSAEVTYETKRVHFSDSIHTRLYLHTHSLSLSFVFSMPSPSRNRGIHVELSLPETRRSIGYENERHRCGKSARGYVYTLGMCLSIKLSGIVFSGT